MRIKVDDPPSGHIELFAVDDILRCKVLTNEVPAILIDNWLVVASTLDPRTHGYPDADYWEYEATLESGTPGLLPAGAAIVNYGQAGDGYVKLTSDENYAPFIDIATHAGEPWTTITTHCRLGNLDGIMGLGTGSGYSNLINNSTFEVDTDSWLTIGSVELSRSGDQHRSGSYSMLCHRTAGHDDYGAYQDVTAATTAGQEYTWSVWAYSGTAGSIILGIYDSVAGHQYETFALPASAWRLFSITKTFGVAGADRAVRVWTYDCGDDFYVDDVFLVTPGEWGLVVGTDLSDDTTAHVIISNQQVGLWGVEQTWWDSAGNARGQVDPSAGDSDVLFWLGPSEAGARFKVLGSGDVWLDTLAISADLGDFLFSQADGLLLLGPHCEINDGEWWSLRRQKAAITGAFHQEAGRWLGARGLVIERGTTNFITNPSFETNDTGWNIWQTTKTRETNVARFGDYSLKVVTSVADANSQVSYSAEATTSADTEYTFSIWLLSDGSGDGFLMFFYDEVSAYQEVAVHPELAPNVWQRYSMTRTYGAGCTTRRVGVRGFDEASQTVYLDGAQLEALPYATTYCDGDQGHDYDWTNGAHASTSTRAQTDVSLSTHAGLLSGNDTISMRLVMQMPYDADATWPGVYLIYMWEAIENSRIEVRYRHDTTDIFEVFLRDDDADSVTLSSSAQDFVAGDWISLTFTADFNAGGAGSYKLYVNGALEDTQTTANVAAPDLDSWRVGTDWDGTAGLGVVWSELAVFDNVLSATEVAAMHALQRPLVDAGTMDTPGIYILDGKFRMASSLTGARMDLDETGLMFIDGSGNTLVDLDASDASFTLKSAATGVRLELDPSRLAIGDGPTYDSGAGAWIGVDGGVAKLFVGNSAADKVTWDGSNLAVVGTITINNPGDIDGSTINNDDSWTDDTTADAANAHRILGVTGTWTPTDADTITWADVVLRMGDGSNVSIDDGNTDDMAVKNYLYYNGIATTLQITTDPANIGGTHTLVAVAQNGAVLASIQIVGGGTYISGDWINTGTITATQITGASLSAIYADLGTITAGTINMYSNTWDVDATGFRLNADEICAQVEGVDQVVITKAGGILTGGAGAVRLDAGGLRFTGSGATGNLRSLRFMYDHVGTEYEMGRTYGDWGGGVGHCTAWLMSRRPVGCPWPAGTEALVVALDEIAGDDTRLNVYSEGYVTITGTGVKAGLHVGGTSDPGLKNLIVDGIVGVNNTTPGAVLDAALTATLQVGDGSDSFYMSIKGVVNGEAMLCVENDARMYRFGITVDDTWVLFDDTANAIRMLVSVAGAMKWPAYGIGTLTSDGAGNITAVSDARLKTQVRNTEIGLAEVLQMQGKVWHYTKESGLDTEYEYLGFIADDIEKIVPGAVGRMADGMRTMSYNALMPAFAQAIQEIDTRLTRLEAR